MASTARTRHPLDDRLAKALSHPLRQRILQLLNRKVSSPREIAEELGEKISDVGYHVRMLQQYGAIERVRTEPRRGAVKHFYRATTRAMLDDQQLAQLPTSAQRSIRAVVLGEIVDHVRHALERHGFDRPDAHVSWTTFELDEEGYAEMTALVDGTLERAFEVQARSIERRARRGSDEGELRTELALMHFLPDGNTDS